MWWCLMAVAHTAENESRRYLGDQTTLRHKSVFFFDSLLLGLSFFVGLDDDEAF
jgi:hypothetical protein